MAIPGGILKTPQNNPKTMAPRAERALTVGNRERVVVMNAMRSVISRPEAYGFVPWEYMKKPDILTLVAPIKIAREVQDRVGNWPKRSKAFKPWLTRQRHLFSQMRPGASVQASHASRCFVQLPGGKAANMSCQSYSSTQEA